MKHLSNLLPYLPSAILLAGCGNHSKQTAPSSQLQKPNVIYLISDDLGIGDLSCYGATKVSTPNIDRLAGQGMQFTNAYATSSTIDFRSSSLDESVSKISLSSLLSIRNWL